MIRRLSIIGGLTILVGIGIYFSILFSSNTTPSTIPSEYYALQIEERVSAPVRIKIPGINVDSVVEHVTVAADGTMDVPKQQFNTAWYSPGTRPGEVGSAVITGHVDWPTSKRAVFTDLSKLKPGDRVIVQNEKGIDLSFVVRTSKIYQADDDATDVFTSYDGLSHVNLITCQGAWNTSDNTYSERLVVFTDKE